MPAFGMVELCPSTATGDTVCSAAAPAARCSKCLRGVFMAYPPEMQWHAERISPFAKLLGLDVGCDNHITPFLGFVGDELAELGRRTCEHRSAQICKPRYEF